LIYTDMPEFPDIREAVFTIYHLEFPQHTDRHTSESTYKLRSILNIPPDK
jgi:hypothetical protein